MHNQRGGVYEMASVTQKDLTRLKDLLSHIAHEPTCNDLWTLRGTLLVCTQDQPEGQLVNEVAREFYIYLSELQSKMTARQYNELASRLDIGSVGMLALQDIIVEHEHLWTSLLLGGIGEGLMVLASRQYIKAWEQELKSVHRRAAWTLYGVLWQLSHQYQPEMASNERQALIETTLAPALDEQTPFETKALMLLRLFQTVLLLLAAPLCARGQQ
jgi:hypothetical protein